MKKQYSKPEITTEVLLKDDVLRMSEETDNRYVGSKKLIKNNFDINDIFNNDPELEGFL